MIRINLLPHRGPRRRAQPGQESALVGLLALAAVAGACYLWNGSKQRQVDEVNHQNQQIEKKIADIKARIGDVHLLEAEKTELERESQSIKNLTDNRQLPSWAMHELSKILTKDHEPSYLPAVYEELQKRDPAAAFDPSWDPKALWLSKFIEKDHAITIDGGARSQDDVAELVKRLSVSVYFQNVHLTSIARQAAAQFPGGPNLDFYAFSLTAKVIY